jgi:O-antigen/teichoic acid export membrane protein
VADAEFSSGATSGRPKKATVRRNVVTNYLGTLAVILVVFLTTPLLAHGLGILRFGVWTLIGSLIPFLELLELGFAGATVAYVSRHLELEDDDKITATLNTSFLCLSVLGIVAFAGVVVFTIFLPDLITSIPKSLVGQAQFLLLLIAFDMALSIPMDTFGGALVALQRYDLLNYSMITVMVAQAIGWVIVLGLHGGLIALGVVTVAISLMGQVSRLMIVHRLLPWFRLSLRRFDRSLFRAYSSLSGRFSIAQISDAIISLSDVLIVGAIAGVGSAAIYGVASRLSALPQRIVQPRAALVFPEAGRLAARDDWAGVRERTDAVVRVVLYLSVPAAIALGFLAGPTLEAWVGPLYREAAGVIGLLCLAGVVQAWALPLRNALQGAGRTNLVALVYGIEAVLHLGLGIALTSRYGVLGMAEAALIGAVVMEGMLMLPLGYRGIGDSLRSRASRAVRVLGLPVVAMSCLAWVLGRGGGPLYAFTDTHGRIAGLAVVAAAGIPLVVVFYALLLVALPSDQRRQVLVRCRIPLGRLTTRLTTRPH